MQKGQKSKIFKQFYLTTSTLENLHLTSTSKYEKVRAYTKGCFIKKKKNLYQNLKAFNEDLQTILQYDPQSASIVFESIYSNHIRFQYHKDKAEQASVNQILVQCRRCGKYTGTYKYCPRCQDVHYCSETCQVNVKLTHEKQQCKVRSYPKYHHAVLIEVHFGSNMGRNIQIYFQHQGRAYGLIRGKQILKDIYETLKGIKKSILPQQLSQSQSQFASNNRNSIIEQKIQKYNIELRNQQKYLQLIYRNEKDYPTGTLKVELEDIDALKRIYQNNQILQEIQLYLLGEGAIMTHCTEEIHNNHAHWVYLFRMP